MRIKYGKTKIPVRIPEVMEDTFKKISPEGKKQLIKALEEELEKFWGWYC